MVIHQYLRCLVLFLAGCPYFVARAEGGHPPHPQADGVRSLDVYSDRGFLHQLTGEVQGGEVPLVYRFSQDAGESWSAPIQVSPGAAPAHGLRRGMDAQVAAHGNRVFVAWMTPGTDRWGAGPIATAFSEDGGRRWHQGPNPSDDGTTTGHGFLDAAFDDQGVLHLVWLDSRDGKQGLRGARSKDGGKTWGTNQTLKADSCECCANALASGVDGKMAVLFRDREPRDMGVVAYSEGIWSRSETVAPFGWELEGCPHSGGGIAFSRTVAGKTGAMEALWRLNAVVWNGKPETAGVYRVSRVLEEGHAWEKPVRMGGKSAMHPDLAASGTRLMAVWSEGSVLRGAVSVDGGVRWRDWMPPDADRRGLDHPRVVPIRSGFRVFWTESYERGKVGVGSLQVPLE